MAKKMNLTNKMMLSLLLGIIFGIFIHNFKEIPFVKDYVIDFFLTVLGNIFIRGIRMIVVPLVFFSLILGASGIDDIAKLGRIGAKTLIYYMGTTAFSIAIAIGLANVIKPGVGLNMSTVVAQNVSATSTPSFATVLTNMVPVNPIESMAKGDMLPIILFAITVGVAMSMLGKKVDTVRNVINEGNEINLKLIEIVMTIAPIGVFALISKTFATFGFAAALPLVKYISVVILGLFIQCLFTYQALLYFVAKYNPLKFFKKFFPVMVVGFSTSSSAACLSQSMKSMENDFGVSNLVSSFTIPLGNTINMNGTSIMQGVATVFIAQIYGVDLTLANYVSIILTATLAAVGTAGVPGVGVIMLGMVLVQVGLPMEGIGLVMGVDRIVDMFRTTINVTGDAVCTLAIARTENEITDVA